MKSGTAILAGLITAAVLLVGVELVWNATAGSVTIENPCGTREPFPGSGIDATIQRVVLNGLDGAACELHTSREELVLSIGGGTVNGERKWDKETIETAIRAGMLRAVDEAGRRGDVPSFLVPALRRLVEEAPIDKLVEGGFSLSDLLG